MKNLSNKSKNKEKVPEKKKVPRSYDWGGSIAPEEIDEIAYGFNPPERYGYPKKK